MTIIQTGFLLMAAGMGTVFASLAVFFVVIVVLEKLCKSSGKNQTAEGNKQ
ncbi:MAG: OadG family protein [Spirochaetales bacterium]|nr:OadG family protein [Spirochaetales bacterium]